MQDSERGYNPKPPLVWRKKDRFFQDGHKKIRIRVIRAIRGFSFSRAGRTGHFAGIRGFFPYRSFTRQARSNSSSLTPMKTSSIAEPSCWSART